jgi:hypothetical protein
MFQIEGQEVLLRPLVESDAPLLAAASAESRENCLYNPVPDGVDGAQAYITRALELLTPRLRPGAVVMADNIFTFKRDLKPYVDYV